MDNFGYHKFLLDSIGHIEEKALLTSVKVWLNEYINDPSDENRETLIFSMGTLFVHLRFHDNPESTLKSLTDYNEMKNVFELVKCQKPEAN